MGVMSSAAWIKLQVIYYLYTMSRLFVHAAKRAAPASFACSRMCSRISHYMVEHGNIVEFANYIDIWAGHLVVVGGGGGVRWAGQNCNSSMVTPQ